MQNGRYIFMHNGGIGGYYKVLRRLLTFLDKFAFDYLMKSGAPTDSMVAFAMFLTHMNGDFTSKRSPEQLRTFLDVTIRTIDSVCREEGVNDVTMLNFVLADGDTLLASRFVSSYFA
jgi:glutamine amidotransferase